jgi:hypothetical protein
MQVICHYIDEIQVPKITILFKEAADGRLHFVFLQCLIVCYLFFHFISCIKTGPYHWLKLQYDSSQTLYLIFGLHMLSGLTGQVLEHRKIYL